MQQDLQFEKLFDKGQTPNSDQCKNFIELNSSSKNPQTQALVAKAMLILAGNFDKQGDSFRKIYTLNSLISKYDETTTQDIQIHVAEAMIMEANSLLFELEHLRSEEPVLDQSFNDIDLEEIEQKTASEIVKLRHYEDKIIGILDSLINKYGNSPIPSIKEHVHQAKMLKDLIKDRGLP